MITFLPFLVTLLGHYLNLKFAFILIPNKSTGIWCKSSKTSPNDKQSFLCGFPHFWSWSPWTRQGQNKRRTRAHKLTRQRRRPSNSVGRWTHLLIALLLRWAPCRLAVRGLLFRSRRQTRSARPQRRNRPLLNFNFYFELKLVAIK